jgi:hypothetical protein
LECHAGLLSGAEDFIGDGLKREPRHEAGLSSALLLVGVLTGRLLIRLLAGILVLLGLLTGLLVRLLTLLVLLTGLAALLRL